MLGGLHVTTGPLKVSVEPGFQFSPALRECESVRIQLRLLGNAAYVVCLPLLCQGPSGLMLRVSDYILKDMGSNPSWIPDFFRGYIISHSLGKKKTNVIYSK